MKRCFFSLLFLCITAIAFTQNKPVKRTPRAHVYNLVASHQVLLTNYAIFKNHKDEMQGASAFLINYQNKIFAVTAKHLLGDAMGVVPEIKIKELNNYLISWKMFPRVPVNPALDTVRIGATKLNYDLLDKDILLLEVVNTNFKILPLTPGFDLPKKGDTLYIIGCPYSQEKCKQNIYEVYFDSYDDRESMLKYIIKAKFELPGFSGAPVVDANGKVVSILTTGWEEGKTKYVGGTFIKEIEKVK
jgi:Trypsin-like peptidase domain